MLLQENPEDLVNMWWKGREWYLSPVDAGWYKRLLPSPPMHYMIPYDMGKWSMNAWAAPRSFAKSTVVREMALFLLLTRPHFSTALIQATEKKFRKSMRMLYRQFVNNRYINDDFSAYYGTPLKPKRGERSWNTDMMELPNGSVIEGLSVNGALRGERPDLLLVDDPEYDEDEEDSEKKIKLIEDFEKLLFKTLLGMLDDGSGIFWIGTMISRQSFLYHVCSGSDERFLHWNRRVLSGEDRNADGTLLWEAKWDEQVLRDKRQKLGESAYASEMLNLPGSASDRILKIHPDLNTYRVNGAPEQEINPLRSTVDITWADGVRDEGKIALLENHRQFGDWASELYRIACVDYAPTVKASSDYSCVAVMGFDRSDTLWLLDLFLGKVREDALIRMIFELSQKWRVRAIGVEAVSVQKHLADRVTADFAKRTEGTSWIPRVIPVRYPGRLSKSERIAGLEWRFNQYRIRLPAHRAAEPGIRDLFYQLENFTPDLSLLRWDDAVDTIAMHQYMLRRQGTGARDRGPNLKTPLELLQAGIIQDEETGLAAISGLNAADLPMSTVRDLLHKKYEDADIDAGEPEVTWNTPTSSPFSVAS